MKPMVIKMNAKANKNSRPGSAFVGPWLLLQVSVGSGHDTVTTRRSCQSAPAQDNPKSTATQMIHPAEPMVAATASQHRRMPTCQLRQRLSNELSFTLHSTSTWGLSHPHAPTYSSPPTAQPTNLITPNPIHQIHSTHQAHCAAT